MERRYGDGGYGEGVLLYPVTFPLIVPAADRYFWSVLSYPAYLILWILPERRPEPEPEPGLDPRRPYTDAG